METGDDPPAANAGGKRGEGRLAGRFGAPVLAAGYTVTPNLLLRHAARLGLMGGELLLVQYVWQHWWDGHTPHPSVGLLAREMGRSPRTIRYYLQGLREKGLLSLEERSGPDGARLSNGFDFGPLIAAVVRLAEADCKRLQSPPATGCTGPLQALAADQDHPGTQEHTARETLDRGEPRAASATPEAEPASSGTPAGEPTRVLGRGSAPPGESPAITELLAAIGQEFGDEAHPRVSARRAGHLFVASGLSTPAFLECLLDARAATRANAARVTRRRAGDPGGRKNLMPYFFATLEGLARCDDGEARGATGGVEPFPLLDGAGQAPDQQAPAAAGEDTGAGDSLWARVQRDVRAVLAPAAFARWLAPARLHRQTDATLEILVPAAMHRQWLEDRLGPKVREALARAGAGQVRVIYRTAAEVAGMPDGAEAAEGPGSVHNPLARTIAPGV
jgi:hypothetical protein